MFKEGTHYLGRCPRLTGSKDAVRVDERKGRQEGVDDKQQFQINSRILH